MSYYSYSFHFYCLRRHIPSPLSSKWFKMISSTMSITPAPEFFEPLRRTVITNLLGYLPLLNTRGAVSEVAPSHAETVVPSNDIQSDVPVVTYISRQGGARRLSDADHEGLVQSLRDLESEGICRVNVVRMETMSVKEQVAVASRSTVGHLLLSYLGKMVYLFSWSTGADWRSWKWTDGKQAVLSRCEYGYSVNISSMRYGCRLLRDPPSSKSSLPTVSPLSYKAYS